jgi:hypothetical protein
VKSVKDIIIVSGRELPFSENAKEDAEEAPAPASQLRYKYYRR